MVGAAMNDWGGAQWVMLGLILGTLLLNIVGFCIQKRPLKTRLQWLDMKVVDAGVLGGILVWGGFF